MPIPDDDKIIICCFDLQAQIETLKLTLNSIEAGVQLRASKGKNGEVDIDAGAAAVLIALAEKTMEEVAATTGAFHQLRDDLFGFDGDD